MNELERELIKLGYSLDMIREFFDLFTEKEIEIMLKEMTA
jgi:hypothetical protein